MKPTWSPLRTLIAGAALVVTTNAVALIGVVYNRSGEPESELKLSERELPLPAWHRLNKESSGIALRLDWRIPEQIVDTDTSAPGFYPVGSPAWLDRAKLSELGFDVSASHESAAGARHYARQLPREVLLVLELNGPAYRSARDWAGRRAEYEAELFAANPDKPEFERRAQAAQRELQRVERRHSRLFVVDAGLDAQQLRERHKDRSVYAIVRGKIRAAVVGPASNRRLSGYVTGLSVATVNVDRSYRPLIEPLLRQRERDGGDAVPRYEVTVAFGRRLEPWIESLSVPLPR